MRTLVEEVLNGLSIFIPMDGMMTFYLNRITVFVKTNPLIVLRSRILS